MPYSTIVLMKPARGQRPSPKRMHQNTIQKVWVPKVLLEAQGYYKDVCNVRILRRSKNKQSPTHVSDSKTLLVNPAQHHTVSKQRQPKAISFMPLLQDKATMKTCDTTTNYQPKPIKKDNNMCSPWANDHASSRTQTQTSTSKFTKGLSTL